MAAGDDVCKIFSREQVSEHNDNNNSWLIIHNNVYDVTAFLNEVSCWGYWGISFKNSMFIKK